MDLTHFFTKPTLAVHRQYEALRMYYVDGASAAQVALAFGYKYRAFTSIVSDFKKKCANHLDPSIFFAQRRSGRLISKSPPQTVQIVVALRKKNFSVEDIKIALDAVGESISENTIFHILKKQGFARLPKRTKNERKAIKQDVIEAPKTQALSYDDEQFKVASGAILCFLPLIHTYGIDTIIEQSQYPQTRTLSRLQSILSFICLKLSNIRRYSADDIWCMDRGLGLFAGLNNLPKTTWFSTYSNRVTSAMNTQLLKQLHKIWIERGLLGDTVNMDFTTIPYWGDDTHLENNWSGKRNKALSSILAVLAQDSDSGIINYGHAGVRHKNESSEVLEFLDFYRSAADDTNKLRYIVFDSKFTNYKNLSRLDDDQIRFITIRRRGKTLVDKIQKLPKTAWKTIRVEQSSNKKRTLKVCDEKIFLRGYDKNIRQIIVTGHGKIKPALIITNDFEKSTSEIVSKYAKRWLVEKTISEKIEFFHLNRVSSSMVIKVDFDLTMSIVAYNLYRIMATQLEGYSHCTAMTLYEKFIDNQSEIKIKKQTIEVHLKKKRNLPLLLETMNNYEKLKYPCFENRKLQFYATSYS